MVLRDFTKTHRFENPLLVPEEVDLGMHNPRKCDSIFTTPRAPSEISEVGLGLMGNRAQILQPESPKATKQKPKPKEQIKTKREVEVASPPTGLVSTQIDHSDSMPSQVALPSSRMRQQV